MRDRSITHRSTTSDQRWVRRNLRSHPAGGGGEEEYILIFQNIYDNPGNSEELGREIDGDAAGVHAWDSRLVYVLQQK